MNKNEANVIHRKLAEGMKKLCQEIGIEYKDCSGSFSSSGELNFRVKAHYIDKNTGVSTDEKLWNINAPLVGFKAEDFGREITLNQTRYKVAGFHPTKPKFCISLKRVGDGAMINTTIEALQRALLAASKS